MVAEALGPAVVATGKRAVGVLTDLATAHAVGWAAVVATGGAVVDVTDLDAAPVAVLSAVHDCTGLVDGAVVESAAV